MNHERVVGVCIQPGCVIDGIDGLLFCGSAHIGSDTQIQAAGGVKIGHNVIISYRCVLWSIDHRYAGDLLPYDKVRLRRPITIEDNVWLGRNVLVCGGLTIGEGAVVAMGSVLSRDVPPLAIVGGNPARVLGYRDVRRYQSLVQTGCFLLNHSGTCAACQDPDYVVADGGAQRPGDWMYRLQNRWRHWRWIQQRQSRHDA